MTATLWAARNVALVVCCLLALAVAIGWFLEMGDDDDDNDTRGIGA